MMIRRKQKTSICPSFGKDETVISDSLSHGPFRVTSSKRWLIGRADLFDGTPSSHAVMVRSHTISQGVAPQDEHLFYHDGLPSYGNGDNCL